MASTRAKKPTPDSAAADIFIMAFKSLPSTSREKILAALLSAEDLRDDIEGALLWHSRKHETRKPLKTFLTELRHSHH